jgi:ferredoxin
VAAALASGKRAALAIHLSLTGAFSAEALAGVGLGGGPALSLEAFFRRPPAWRPGEVVPVNDWDLLLTPNQEPEAQLHLPPEARRSTLAEVVQGLAPDQAQAEAGRCYYCGVCVDCGACRLLCPDAALGPAFAARDEHCKGCGTCAAACVRGVLSLGERG